MKGSYLARLITLVVVAALLALGVGVTAPAQAENTTQIMLGIDRALLAKASAVELTGSPLGKGAWFVNNSTTKMEIYFDPTKPPLNALGSFKIDDIQSISYQTKKPTDQGSQDFFLVLYTVPDGNDDTSSWYGYRLNAEPYFSKSLNAPADTWNTWTTDETTNQLTFFDTAKTGTYGFYGQPTLQDLQNGPINWSNYNSSYTNQSIDYGNETVKYISIQTGSGWSSNFTGYLDAITISLKNGTTITIDLEAYYDEAWVDDNADLDWYLIPGHFAKIQDAIDAVAPGGTVYVYPGTYTENIRITKKLTLLSTAGREQTTIQGISGQDALGTILISNNTDGVQIGDVGYGFKIIGIDNNNPGVENAAIYFQGNHSNAVIKGNEIVANGDHGLLTEYSAIITGFTIDSNVFSGKTFQGDKPAGNGFGQQFELPNVPRQLVVMGGGASGTGTTNITFTNNRIIGTAGGFNDDGQPQGNTLVTLDAEGSRIEDNVFEGVTSGYATSLRVRRPNVSIEDNVFKSTGLLSPATGHLYLLNNPIDDSVIANNTFDKGVYIENPTGGTIGTNVSLFATAAPTNSVIHVLPGTYEEQVVVSGKTLTLQGEGDDPADVVIKSPTTLSAKFTTSVDNKPVVLVQNNANVTIKNLTVDGAGRGNGNYRFIGIGFYNASGTVEEVTVKGVRESPFSGSQHGTGIYAYNQDGTARTLTVRNTTVTDFQKNGITVVGSGLTATIEGNTITGAGSTSIIAQNGIQVSYGAAATVRNNKVSGMAYSGQDWVASGILVYGAGTTTVENNTLTASQANIYVVESSATVRANRISNAACVGEGCYGIVASDPLGARPSPLEETVASTTPAQPNHSGGFTLLGNTNPLDTVTITANEITGTPYASGESVGLGVYEGYADRDVAVSASQNVISGWSHGVYVGRCDPEEETCYSGRLRTFALNENAITRNTVGMGTNLTISLNAERNWWGSARGPQVATNSGGDGQPIEGSTIDYVPWLCDGTDAQQNQIGFQPVSNAETCTNTPTRLRFLVQPPSTAFTNEPFDPQPQVRVEDAQGNLAINYDNAILIALVNNPAGGVLGGTLSADPVNGVATFTNLFLNKPGENYRLIATSGNLTAAYSNYFTVVDPSADLSLSLSAPGSVNAGSDFDYTLTVSNAGPKAANALTLTLNLPAGVTYQSASGSGWACSHSTGVVTCTAASLGSGANTTVTVNVTAPAQAGTLTATASVSADSPTDPVPANNSASAGTTVVVLPPTGGSQIFLPLIMR